MGLCDWFKPCRNDVEQVIGGLRYNTKISKLIQERDNGFWYKRIYKTPNGRYFLATWSCSPVPDIDVFTERGAMDWYFAPPRGFKVTSYTSSEEAFGKEIKDA